MAEQSLATSKKWREPAGRHDHCTAVVDNEVYLWAGRLDGMPLAHDNPCKTEYVTGHMEVFSMFSGCWEKRETIGTPPLGIAGYRCVTARNDLYYFGGWCGHDYCYHNSIHKLFTSTLRWRCLTPTALKDGAPMRKARCGMVYFSDEEEDLLYIVGGVGLSPQQQQPGAQYMHNGMLLYSNEQHLFSLSTNTWMSVTVTGEAPPPCSGFTLTSLGEKRAVLYGGWDGASHFNHLFLAELKRNSMHWTRVSAPAISHSVQWPEERRCHGATQISGSLFAVMGGRREYPYIGTLKHLWICDATTTTTTWGKVSVPDSCDRRFGHSMSTLWLEPHRVWLFVFGGLRSLLSGAVACTTIIEMIQENGVWNMGTLGSVLGRSSLSNSTVYRNSLREERYLPPDTGAGTTVEEAERQAKENALMTAQLNIKHLWQQVELLEGKNNEYEEQKESTEETLEQILEESEALQRKLDEEKACTQQAKYELHTAESRIAELEEENRNLLQLVQQTTSQSMSTNPPQQKGKRADSLEVTNLRKQLRDSEDSLEQSQLKIRKAENDTEHLQQQLEQSLSMSKEAVQMANKKMEEAQQRSVEMAEKIYELELQVGQRREPVREEELPHWLVHREELEMTQEVLGKGSWGKVTVATFRGTRVAVKCLHDLIISSYNSEQFALEMTIAAKLRHPNLLLFIGATREKNPVIITELMPTSLYKELQKEKMSKKHVVSIGRDVCCGVNCLHLTKPHPIIHRDISSKNVLLEPLPNGWRAKVADYGSANFANLISTTVNPGCPLYAAPEAAFPYQHSPKMDVFSLGVLLVEMCLGELPATKPSVNREPQIQRIHWPNMTSLITTCIREKPDDRPNMSELISLFDNMKNAV